MAGGQSLIALMKFRLVSPKTLIDINGLTELNYITERNNGSVAIGALTRHDQVVNSDLLKHKYLFLTEAADWIADQQIRNLGTIGGTLVHADPSADLPPVILALNAELAIVGPKGERTVNAQDFFLDFFTTAIQPDEVLTEIRLPKLLARTGTAYQKFSRRHGDFAIVNVAAIVTLDERNVCKNASVSLGGVASTAVKATGVEQELIGQTLSESKIAQASERAADRLKPPSDIHASAEYRREVSKVITKRVVIAAFQRAQGGPAL